MENRVPKCKINNIHSVAFAMYSEFGRRYGGVICKSPQLEDYRREFAAEEKSLKSVISNICAGTAIYLWNRCDLCDSEICHAEIHIVPEDNERIRVIADDGFDNLTVVLKRSGARRILVEYEYSDHERILQCGRFDARHRAPKGGKDRMEICEQEMS